VVRAGIVAFRLVTGGDQREKRRRKDGSIHGVSIVTVCQRSEASAVSAVATSSI
jgi:hypothetical protein